MVDALESSASIQQVQQALLHELRNGNTLSLWRHEGSPVLYHDGRTFVHTGRTGHGAEFYEVLRGDADALALVGQVVAQVGHCGPGPAWSGVNASEQDTWHAMLAQLRPGRPARPWDAAWRRITPAQRAVLMMAIVVGTFVAVGATAYTAERLFAAGAQGAPAAALRAHRPA